MGEIKNKIKDSGLIQLDLADFKPKQEVVSFDLKDTLWKGLAIKEKDFREFIKINDWSVYEGKVVAVFCSVDAIIPTWAYMLVVSRLQEEEITAFVGNIEQAKKQLISEAIQALDISEYEDGLLIIKGCSDIAFPEFAMTELVKRLQPTARSIMYGEPCSTVPVYKKKRVRTPLQ